MGDDRRRLVFAGLALPVLAWVALAQVPASLAMDPPETVAPGIVLHRLTDASLLDPAAPAGPLAIVAVELDPARVGLSTALAHGCAPARETVAGIAAREEAVVALNAGFFLPRGEPAGVLKQAGRWIGVSSRARGVAAFPASRPGEPARVVLSRATVAATVHFRSRLRRRVVPIDHLSPQAHSEGLTFFGAPCSPAEDVLDATTLPPSGAVPAPAARETAASGAPVPPAMTWHLDRAGRVVAVSGPPEPGDVAIDAALPRLEYRGAAVPRELTGLRRGRRATVVPRVQPADAAVLAQAPDAVAGAGLLISKGIPVTDWTMERLSPAFATDRHPRSVIGVDAEGDIWLIAVDGRQSAHSVGMSFAELQRLGLALGLREALNLDGGGSTTLVVQGRIVNRPSDLTGPRPVSDAIVVRRR